MAGTKAGAQKSNQTKDLLYGPEWRSKQASIGGKARSPGNYGTTRIGKDGLTGPQRAKEHRLKQLEGNKNARTAPEVIDAGRINENS